jgi:ribosomal-protein-alanine N-acetyltransferase
MTTIPWIETDRLLLREPLESDAAAWAPYNSDPDYRRYIPVRRNTLTPLERATRKLAMLMESWAQEPRTGVGWVVARRSDNQMIGMVEFDLGQEPGDGEIGYYVGKPFWGRGFGRELAHAASRFVAESDLPYERLVAYVVTANAGSIRIAESLGLRFQQGGIDYLRFFPDPSAMELADPICNFYAAPKAELTLDPGHYRVIRPG